MPLLVLGPLLLGALQACAPSAARSDMGIDSGIDMGRPIAAAPAVAAGASSSAQPPSDNLRRQPSPAEWPYRAAVSPGLTAAQRKALSDTVRAVVDRAVRDSAFPGAYAAVGTLDDLLAEYGAGRLDAADATVPDRNTVWDLASLTKVIGTTTAVMQLVDAGRVRLDAPVHEYLPEWNAPRTGAITVRQLLTHSAGLPPFLLFYRQASSAPAARQLVLAVSPDSAPGRRYVYSDIGFMLLGQMVARLSGEPLDAFDRAHIFGPLRMTSTQYLPPPAWLPRIAPTENDPWRGRKIRGEVHDENAASMGGVSGHAGIFATGADLARFARMYLHGGALDGARILSPGVIAQFTSIADPSLSHRALGWETANGTNSAGTRMPATAFGHTGFTGTSIWMDPAHGVFVLLLTNRVNPTRENKKIGSVRIALADAVLAIVADSTPSRRRAP